jgi:pyruvate dehydrogenase E1 component alpha subunit
MSDDGLLEAPGVDTSAPPDHLDREHAVHLLREMTRVRRLEERSAELYAKGKIRGFLHLYIGEEAVAVGAMQALGPEDRIVCTYREHGHALVRGMSAGAIMAEMYGKREGCSRGRGGSMHLFDAQRRFYGGHAIVGGGLPVAVGLALADHMRGDPHVTACFFGDGATDEGEFHESLNLAELWKLPVLFICENNLYAMGTALSRHESRPDISAKPQVYGIPSEQVDGMDVLAVEAATRRAVEVIRHAGMPYMLELRTYRFRAHSMYDAELYRDKAEVEAWKRRCPLATYAARLRRWGWLDDAALAQIEADAAAEVDAAVQYAEDGTWEPVEDLLKDVYTT